MSEIKSSIKSQIEGLADKDKEKTERLLIFLEEMEKHINKNKKEDREERKHD